jgi:hypothetical protein
MFKKFGHKNVIKQEKRGLPIFYNNPKDTPPPRISNYSASDFLLDDSASQSGPRASGLEAVRTSAKSEVIDLLVDDDGPAVDASLAFRIQRDFVVEDAHQGRVAVGGGLDVAEVAEMSYCRRFAAVCSLKVIVP